MRKTQLAAVPAVIALALTAGCNNGNSSSSSSSDSKSTTSAAATSSSSSASLDCPTDGNTRSFAKTRFVADIGLAAGTFHRYIYKPYQAGSFKKGADGRIKAMIKAGATGALDAKLLSNAEKNIKANPTLCKVLAKPISDAAAKVKNLKTDIASGNMAAITSANTLFSDIENKAKSNGASVTETTDESKTDFN